MNQNMKTKIIYVLSSSCEDTYLEQTLISTYSARLHNPDANIFIVTDRPTYSTIKDKRAEIKKYISDFIVIDIPPEYNNMQKSRYLKTNLRAFVQGDFLYIDSDTVIAENLSEIDSFDSEIGAVYDSNRPFLIGETNSTSDWYINSNIEKLGWPSVKGYPNYNGGVLYVKDTEVAHKFYNRWYELWLECVRQGVSIDMAALCRANIEMGCCIKELPAIWNCQIQREGLVYLPQAKIIHCFTGGNLTLYELCSEEILNKIKVSGVLDEEIIELIQHAKNAFPVSTSIVKSEEANLLKLPIFRLYSKNRFLFNTLNLVAKVYLKLFSSASR